MDLLLPTVNARDKQGGIVPTYKTQGSIILCGIQHLSSAARTIYSAFQVRALNSIIQYRAAQGLRERGYITCHSMNITGQVPAFSLYLSHVDA